MTSSELANILFEDAPPKLSPKVKVFLDRLLMRFFQSPSVIASLTDVSAFKRSEDSIIQLSFRKIPDEVLPKIERSIGLPKDQIRFLKFDRHGAPQLGLELTITPEMLKQAEEFEKERKL